MASYRNLNGIQPGHFLTHADSSRHPASADDEYAAVAEFYDFVLPYRERSDVAFYVEAARESGGPVLEVGCGTGRMLIPTARAGIEVVGLDASPHILDVCRRRLQNEPADVQARVRLLEGDMRRFTVDQTFRLATIPFRPFQHLLTVNDQLACLACIHHHLADDGRLVFDIFNPSLDMLVTKPVGEEFDADPEFIMEDGRRVCRRGRIVGHDRFTQVTQHELIYYISHPDGRSERLVHAFSMRNTFRFEAEHLLVRAGFDIEHLYADFDKSPYGSKYPGELSSLSPARGEFRHQHDWFGACVVTPALNTWSRSTGCPSLSTRRPRPSGLFNGTGRLPPARFRSCRWVEKCECRGTVRC